MVFGSGVARLSFLTHTHTPPLLTSQWKKTPLPSLPWDFTLSTTVQEHSHTLHYTGLPNCCSSSRRTGSGSRSRTSSYGHSRHCLFAALLPRIFPVFYPRSFPLRIYVTVAVSFPHGRICGSCVVVSLTYKLGEL